MSIEYFWCHFDIKYQCRASLLLNYNYV
jgi:hypothetical protein